MKKTLIAALAATLLAACQSQSMTEEPLRATAALQPTQGNKAFGEVTFEQEGDKVRMLGRCTASTSTRWGTAAPATA
jgi:nitrous oxide reductase accessory protein NosL